LTKKKQGLTESIWWPDLGTGRGCFTIKFTEISPPVLPLFLNKNHPPVLASLCSQKSIAPPPFCLSMLTKIAPPVLPFYINRNGPLILPLSVHDYLPPGFVSLFG